MAENIKKLSAGDDSIPDVFKPQTKEELYADLELALEQVKRGEGIPIEQFEEEIDAEMEQAWQEMLNGGGMPLEDFLKEFEFDKI